MDENAKAPLPAAPPDDPPCRCVAGSLRCEKAEQLESASGFFGLQARLGCVHAIVFLLLLPLLLVDWRWVAALAVANGLVYQLRLGLASVEQDRWNTVERQLRLWAPPKPAPIPRLAGALGELLLQHEELRRRELRAAKRQRRLCAAAAWGSLIAFFAVGLACVWIGHALAPSMVQLGLPPWTIAIPLCAPCLLAMYGADRVFARTREPERRAADRAAMLADDSVALTAQSAGEVLASGGDFALYLRSFADEPEHERTVPVLVDSGGPEGGRLTHRPVSVPRELDTKIACVVTERMPFITVMNVRDVSKSPWTLAWMAKDETWEGLVRELMPRARLVVVLFGSPTPGITRELELVEHAGAAERTVMLLHPDAAVPASVPGEMLRLPANATGLTGLRARVHGRSGGV